jgi:uncharacterized membrane protein YhhN
MQRSLPLLFFIVFSGILMLQNINTRAFWPGPFLVVLAVILLVALTQQARSDDDF